jgi:serine/threonine protein kinase
MIRCGDAKYRRGFPRRWKKCRIEMHHSELLIITKTGTRRVPLTRQTSTVIVSQYWTKSLLIRANWHKLYIRTANPLEWLLDLRTESFCDANISMAAFECLAVLGRSAFGKVTLIRHRQTRELFALKSIHKSTMVRTSRIHTVLSERSVLESLAASNSPFLTRMRFAFQSATKFYIGLEFAPGGDLAGLFSRSQAVPIGDARIYVAELALAMNALHECGIVYRDVKPENILIGADGHLRIADFGLSKQIGIAGRTASFCGTLDFLAPEIVLGRRYGVEIDWWGLGVLAYMLIFGESPFFDANRERMMRKIVSEGAKFPRDADPAAVALIEKLLAKEPRARFGFKELKAHRFFDGMSWEDVVAKRVAPDFVPALGDASETMYFDEEFTQEPASDSAASLPVDDDPFTEFDFVNIEYMGG